MDAVAFCPNAVQPQTTSTRTIYTSALTPDVDAAARNANQVCSSGEVEALDGTARTAVCAGVITAEIDGVPVDFTAQRFCTFKSDGNRFEYIVKGITEVNSPTSKELTMRVRQQAGSVTVAFDELFTAPVGLLDAGAAYAAPFGVAQTFVASTFATDGSALAGTFDFVVASPFNQADQRQITNGVVDITFIVQ